MYGKKCPAGARKKVLAERVDILNKISLHLQVVFEGIRGKSWQGDIAIDDVKIENCDGGGGGGGGGGNGCGESRFKSYFPYQ